MYEIQETLETIDDLAHLALYIYTEFSNEMAAEKLIEAYSQQINIIQAFPTAYCCTELYYRNYLIRKCPCGNINIFYIIDEKNKQIIILRVLHNLQNWEEKF